MAPENMPLAPLVQKFFAKEQPLQKMAFFTFRDLRTPRGTDQFPNQNRPIPPPFSNALQWHEKNQNQFVSKHKHALCYSGFHLRARTAMWERKVQLLFAFFILRVITRQIDQIWGILTPIPFDWLKFGIDFTLCKSTSHTHFQHQWPLRPEIEVISGHGIWLNILSPNGHSFGFNRNRRVRLVPKARYSAILPE